MATFAITSNHTEVIKCLEDLGRIVGNTVGVEISRDTAQRVAERAYGYAHVGKDPTSPKGRPHTRDTIRVRALNQYASQVVADHGAFWEERRGGDHAFLSRAVADIEPSALIRFEQLGLDAVKEAGG
jgi:hypothetical protein